MKLKVTSQSPGNTNDMGKKFSEILGPGDVILLSGELGGGKTTFIGGIAFGLGIKEELTSPSFTIINEYPIGRKKFIHADLYRIDGVAEIEQLGISDYLYDRKNIVCIEWGDKLAEFLEKDFLLVDFKYDIDAEEKRKLAFSSSSGYWDSKLEKLKKILERHCFF